MIKNHILNEELKTLEAQMAETDFWNDVENANKVTTRVKTIKNKLERLAKLDGQSADVETLIEMAEEEDDESLLEELKSELNNIPGSYAILFSTSLDLTFTPVTSTTRHRFFFNPAT